MKAILRNARLSPTKAHIVAGMVRGRSVKEALSLLPHVPKKGARLFYKVIQSAAANAKNNFKQSLGDLYIQKLIVTKAGSLKRSVPASRGRVKPVVKRNCHIFVEVGLKAEEAPKKKSAAKTVSK